MMSQAKILSRMEILAKNIAIKAAEVRIRDKVNKSWTELTT